MALYGVTKNSVQPNEPPRCPEFTLCTILNMSRLVCETIDSNFLMSLFCVNSLFYNLLKIEPNHSLLTGVLIIQL